MKEVFPDYYPRFRCMAGACRHNCCIGWEIDIDDASLSRYRAMPGALGERIRSHIALSDTPHFELTKDERCPLLNANGLCDLILGAGEDALCQICADHPRFRNVLSDRTETGLGLCCEAAARLILSQSAPMRLITTQDDDKNLSLPADEAYMLQNRAQWLSIVQDRSMPFHARMETLIAQESLCLPQRSMQEWAAFYDTLERLDPAWTQELSLLKSAKTAAPLADEQWQIVLEQLFVYFLYRHIAAFENEEMILPRLAFCLVSTRMLCTLAKAHLAQEHSFSFNDFYELSRMYSAEIEYSQENIDALLDELLDV